MIDSLQFIPVLEIEPHAKKLLGEFPCRVQGVDEDLLDGVNAGLKVLNASGIIVLIPINIYAHP